MTNENDDGAADIAWMRKLAEENADAPMRGGSILMAAGLIAACERERGVWRAPANRVAQAAFAVSESIGEECGSLVKPSRGAPPTRWVGESGVTSSGWALCFPRSVRAF